MNLEAAKRLATIVQTGRPDLSPVVGSATSVEWSAYFRKRLSDGPYFVVFKENQSTVELHGQEDWVTYARLRVARARCPRNQETKNKVDTIRYFTKEETEQLGGAAGSCFCCGGPVEALLTIRTGYECFRGDWYLCLEHRYLNSENIRQNVVEI